MARGKFITLEGGEGAGKSTQAKKLAAFLRKQAASKSFSRAKSAARLRAEEIRKLWLSQDEGYWEPLSELMLIFAARRDHLVRTIWPALKRGEWVVCDRFMDSTRAYQGIAKNAPGRKSLISSIARSPVILRRTLRCCSICPSKPAWRA